MRITTILCASILITCGCSSHAPAQTKTPPAARITEITVKGVVALTRASIITSSGLAVGQPCTQAGLDTAAKQLRELGVFGFGAKDPADAVKVSSEVKAKKARIIIQVIENPVVKSIEFNSAGPVNPGDLMAAMQTRAGSILDLHKIQHDLTAVHDAYEEAGYQASIGDEVGVKDGVLTIPVTVSKIRQMSLAGLRRRDAEDILKLIKSKEGTYYNIKQVKEDLVALAKTGYFREVEPKFSFPSPGMVDLTITVRER